MGVHSVRHFRKDCPPPLFLGLVLVRRHKKFAGQQCQGYRPARPIPFLGFLFHFRILRGMAAPNTVPVDLTLSGPSSLQCGEVLHRPDVRHPEQRTHHHQGHGHRTNTIALCNTSLTASSATRWWRCASPSQQVCNVSNANNADKVTILCNGTDGPLHTDATKPGL